VPPHLRAHPWRRRRHDDSALPTQHDRTALSVLILVVLTTDWIAFQHAIQATPRLRAIAETVVSSWRSESTAQSMARVLSLARRAAKAWSSVQLSCGQADSGQRQIRLAQRHRNRAAEGRRVVQDLHPPAVTDRDHTAVRQRGVRLDVDHEPAVVVGGHVKDMQSLDTKQSISPRTAHDRGPTPTVGHVKAFPSAASSPLIVKALTRAYDPDTPPIPSTATTLNWEGPSGRDVVQGVSETRGARGIGEWLAPCYRLLSTAPTVPGDEGRIRY